MTTARTAAPLRRWPAHTCGEGDAVGVLLLDVEAVGLDRLQYPRALFVCGWGEWLSKGGLASVFVLSSHTQPVSWGKQRHTQTCEKVLE